MADYVEYGDTDGTIAGRERAGDQALPAIPIPTNDPAFLYGDADILAGRAVGGDDRIAPASFSENFEYGDARLMTDNAQGGNDLVTAFGFRNTLHGDAEEMNGRARGGDDVLEAGGGPFARTSAENFLYGDAYRMSDRTEGGDDTLTGANGYLGTTSRLFGDAFELTGRAEGGDDRVVSGARGDEMWGDAFTVGPDASTGADTFVFAPGNGRDIIHDFEPGKDRIDLTAFAATGLDTFEELSNLIHVQPDGTLVILDLGSVTGVGNSVVVAGAQGLTADDLMFG